MPCHQLRTLLILIAVVPSVLAGVGCGQDKPSTGSPPQPAAERAMICLSVSMPVARQFPNSDELATRDAIIEELEQRLGDSAGSGGGFGQMDFAFNVEDEASARALITEVVKKHLPGAAFTITRVDPEEQ